MMDNARIQRKIRKLNKEVEKFFNGSNCLASQSSLTNNVSQTVQNLQVADFQNDASVTNADSDEGSVYEFIDSFSSNSFQSDNDNDNEGFLADNYNNDNLEEIDFKNNFSAQFSKWCATSNCAREKLNELLGILRSSGGHSELPKDIRTLIHTPRDISSILKCGGEYIYSGIHKGIIETFSNYPNLKNSNVIKLDLNIDGLPLSKSSKSQLWSILGSINSSDHVFTIATFHGYSKPNPVDEFLLDFIEESNEYLDNEVTINDVHYDFKIRVIICDAPARSFLKCIIGHTGYISCERCLNKGQSCQRRIVYNSTEGNNQLRSGEQFLQMKYYPEHQKERSPLLNLHNFDCVLQMPLDYMYLILQSVLKRMWYYLIKGPKECRISSTQVNEISDRLVSFSGLMPSEFCRQPRSLSEISYWKATEFRQLLL